MSIRSTLPVSVPRHGHYAAPIPEQGICWAGSAASVKTVNLALQGGGAHGAFAWGVLDRLLEDERIVLDGVSAAIAGVLSAARLASGVAVGGQAGAKRAFSNVVAPACVPCFVGTTAAQPVRLAKRELYARSSPTSMRAGRWEQGNEADADPRHRFADAMLELSAISELNAD